MIQKYSPVDGALIGEFPIASEDEVQEAVRRARAAFISWRAASVRQRMTMLSRVKDVIAQDADDFARRISQDTGKPLVDSMMLELISVPFFLDYYEKTAQKVLGRRRVATPIVFPGKASYIEHMPMGVIGVISPWNFPFQLAMIPALSALIAGNTVVLKPSEVTPITGVVIEEIMRRAELPEGVFQVVHGDGSTGAALTRADVDKIFFTGSVATGKKIMKAAAERPIPVELELGGKDAMIVCDDAPMERAARAAAWGGLVNCGQVCVSVERVFVHESIHDEFVAMVKREVDRLRLGGPDEDADIGPLTFPPQLDTVEQHVADALARGATLIRGGHRVDRPGQFYAPAILTGVTPEMEIYREETFGPVLPIIKVRSDDEAVQLANDHQYGLTGSVWTRDRSRGLRIASRMECGQVMINDVIAAVGNPALPFGGVKASGFGRYHGAEGLLSFTHQKSIMADRGFLSAEPFWFPYQEKYPHVREVFDKLSRGNLPGALGALTRLRKLTT